MEGIPFIYGGVAYIHMSAQIQCQTVNVPKSRKGGCNKKYIGISIQTNLLTELRLYAMHNGECKSYALHKRKNILYFLADIVSDKF